MTPSLEPRTFPVRNEGQVTLVIVPAILLSVATAAVILRFHARHLKGSRYFADDYLALLALLCAYGEYIANLVMVLGGGSGITIKNIARKQLVVWFKGLVAKYVFWVSATGATQISLLCFYIRIFGVLTWFRVMTYTAIGIVSGWWISAFISEVTACIPLEAAWTPGLHGKCINDEHMCTSIGLIHVIFDFFIVLLPIPVIWRIRMSTSARSTLTLIFGLGIFASICSILRMSCLIKLGGQTPDATGSWKPRIYQSCEAPIGIFCACVPNLPPVWEQFLRTKFGSSVKYIFTHSQPVPSNGSQSTGGKSSFAQSKGGKGDSTSRVNQETTWSDTDVPLPLQDIESTGSQVKLSQTKSK